jgi:cell division transport system ATP-binding protein
VFQDFKLLADKTVFENVAFALDVIGKPKSAIDTRVPEILELVGLGEKLNSYPDELSGGEQQRVSIARACVNRPLILLADEPTGNLDPASGEAVFELLLAMQIRHRTTGILVTHNPEIARRCTRTLRLDGGVLHPY